MESLLSLYIRLDELEGCEPLMSPEDYLTQKQALEKQIKDVEYQYLEAQNVW